jgi:voltage-gated potassium channel
MIQAIREIYTLLKKEKFFKILGIACIVILYGALAIYISDQYYLTKGTRGILDAVYWAVVTIASVGYGDIVPVSTMAKVFAMILILTGMGVLSLVTATIASIFVERRIREGEGLEKIKDKDHVVICGWNENAEKVIDSLLTQMSGPPPKIVLVNELDREEIQAIQYRHEEYEIGFVKGNFVKEDVLARANLVHARAAIVLADFSSAQSAEKADERTIFGTMAIKSLAAKVRTCAELIHPENREHLVRAQVDEIIIRGESAGFLLGSAAIAPGVADSIKMLMSNKDDNRLWRIQVPSRHVEKPFGEVLSHFRNRFGAIVLAVVREKERVKLEDILSHDSTFIDEFIRRKFEESGKDFFGSKKDTSVVMNPPDDYVLGKNDWLVVISKERPS